MNFIRRLFCKHRYSLIQNFYDDQIIEHGGKRSKWKCIDCGKISYSDGLNEQPS